MFKFKILNRRKKGESGENLLLNEKFFLQEGRNILENEGSAILIITDGTEQNIIGGIFFEQKELKHLQENLRELLPTGTIYRTHIWECSSLAFEDSQALSCYPPPSEHFLLHFFRTLYEGIVEFGLQNEVKFVVVKLTAEDYLPTKGLWPYVVELPPAESSDDFFYGVLPLRGSAYEAYQKTWKDLDGG